MGKRSESDPQFEMAFYENVLKNSPNFVEALMALGDLYTREGFYSKGLEMDQRLSRVRPDDPIVLYNLACSYSLMNSIEQSRQAMTRAFAAGYNDIAYLQKDPDLLNLLADADFVEQLKAVRSKVGEKMGEVL